MAVRSPALPASLPRLDRRIVLAGLLSAGAAVLVLLLTQPPEQTPVLVAGADLPAGHVLAAEDVGVRYVEDPTGLVVGDAIGELAGFSLSVPLTEGQPLLGPIMHPPEVVDAPRSLALSVPLERAVLGRVAAGDRVDVYVTVADGVAGATTELVAASVYVIASEVADEPGSGDDVRLLLAVDEALARSLAEASHAGAIDVVLVGP